MTPDFHPALSWDSAQKRAAILRRIRTFFAARAVTEVETPILSHACAIDRHLDVLSSTYSPVPGAPPEKREKSFLRTSPEFHMKRLLAAGYGDIYQIGAVFRDSELGRIHNPEFTMLEWYRIGWTMDELIAETAACIIEILGEKPVIRTTYAQSFFAATGCDPLATTIDRITGLCASRSLAAPPFASLTDALQFAMAAIVEPSLRPDAVTVITHFPADQAVLAVIDGRDPRTAKRFEVYCNGIELANGFEELGSAHENELRQQEENRARQALGKEELPLDRNFLAALAEGLPPCSGVALGLDRLVMLALGETTLAEAQAFPWPRS
jgi:lysyl-tRNA synthetase class 2